MKQLSGTDTMFLNIDTENTFGHISSLAILDAPTDGTPPIDIVRNMFRSRLGLVPIFRRRVVEVPFGLDRPWWVEDPNFDLEFHVRHIGVPPPGRMDQLEQLASDIIARPLDRRRPLWEAHVIEGLPEGRFAVLCKTHHAAIDGAAGVLLMALLYSTEPGPIALDGPEPPDGEAIPSPQELMVRAGWNFATRPQRMAAAQNRLWMEGWERAQKTFSDRNARPAATSKYRAAAIAPPTPFNAHLSPHRKVSVGSVPLERIKGIKNAFDATVNDVVMAVCGAGLRAYLQTHDALPDRNLVAGVPVSIRTGDEEDPWTNRVWAMATPLPTTIEDPLDRITFAREAMNQSKADLELVPADALSDFSQFQSPGVFAAAANVMTRMQAGDRFRSITNLVVSNVPGPRQPLYMGTARLHAYYPVSTVAEGQGLNITVHSYLDRLDIGLVADRELVPDLELLVDFMTAEVENLAELAGLPSLDDEPSESADSEAPAIVVDRSHWPDDLDPSAREVLEMGAKAIEAGQPPMWEMTAEQARASYRAMGAMMGPGADVEHVEDLTVPRSDGRSIPVRIYRPRDATLGAAVFYHGGGFVIGDLDSHDRECRRLANEADIVVISVDYGLAPDFPFPTATDDAWTALLWVRDHAEQLGIDPDRLAVCGDSAGGNLAAVTAIRARDEDVPLAHQVLVYPAVDIAEGVDDRYPSRKQFDGITLSQELNQWFMGHYLGDDAPADERLTPIRADLKGVAPALVITAGCDPLRDEGEAYAEALTDAGVETVYTDYPGQIHGFFNLGVLIPDGRNAVGQAAETLRTALGSSTSDG